MKNFKDLTQGNQSQSGTSQLDRELIMNPIIDRNNEKLHLLINGINLVLIADWSLSKKTVHYRSPITKDQYTTILGHSFGLTKRDTPSICMSQDGRITIYAGGNYYEKIMSNKNITVS